MFANKQTGAVSIAILLTVLYVSVSWIKVLIEQTYPRQDLELISNRADVPSVPNNSKEIYPHEFTTPEEAATALFA